MSEPTKDDLYEQAQDADIDGRSSMTKQDLVEALKETSEPAPEETLQREPRTGVYVLERGDNPALVAGKVFGQRSRGRDLVLANPEASWAEGTEINIPN
jgi:hypothetical protein